MGCDIHIYKEKFVNGAWVTADEWTPDEYNEGQMTVDWEKRFTDRNYELFGALSKGVRSEQAFSFEARGLPFDVTPEVKNESEKYEGDGHSHSYLFLHELMAFRRFLDTQTVQIEGMKDRAGLDMLRASIAAGNPDWNLLYPYCASTNMPYESFEFDVPASFAFGKSLDRIIAMFDGVEGSNHRVVFWFDN